MSSTIVAPRAPFWSDDFDMDLLKVLPDTEAILGDLAAVTLYTHGHETQGRLNHPSVWNGHNAMLAFFGTRRDGFKPDDYYTDRPVLECTFLEAVRDAWVHDYLMHINFSPVWNTFELYRRVFEPLMWHRRGWRAVAESAVAELLQELRLSLYEANQRLRSVLAVRP